MGPGAWQSLGAQGRGLRLGPWLAPLGGQKLRVGLGQIEEGGSLELGDHLEVGVGVWLGRQGGCWSFTLTMGGGCRRRGQRGWKMSELRHGQLEVVSAPLCGAGGEASGVSGGPGQKAGDGEGVKGQKWFWKT